MGTPKSRGDFSTAGIIAGFSILMGTAPAIPLFIVTLMLLYGISGTYQPAVQASIPALVAKDHEEYRLIDTQEPAAFQQILPCDLKGRFFPRTLDEGDFDEDFHDCGQGGVAQGLLAAGGVLGGLLTALLGKRLQPERAYVFLILMTFPIRCSGVSLCTTASIWMLNMVEEIVVAVPAPDRIKYFIKGVLPQSIPAPISSPFKSQGRICWKAAGSCVSISRYSSKYL